MLLLVLALLAAPALGRNLKPVPALITDKESHIIGGQDARQGQFPYQGSLKNFLGMHSCGFALLSAKYAVTAAHCVGGGAASMQAQVGALDQTSNEGQTLDIAVVTSHPDFENDGSQGFPNDVAVLEFDGSVEIGGAVAVIELASASDGDFAGQDCVISGWGLTETGGVGGASEILQFANTKVMTQAACNEQWGQVKQDIHICVGGTGAEGACNGDSGGPLRCGTKLAGVTSWGINGCYPDAPSVYTRISNFESWIKGITGL